MRIAIDSKVASSVARSAVVLSRNHLGGCVVLPLSDGFANYLHENSIAWDAPLFDGLIEALFAWRPTSLGAVVVHGTRVVYRVAFLPMAKNGLPACPREWGSRHITALTFTCEVDAVAVVVSEERGDITIFAQRTWATEPFPKLDDDATWQDMESRVRDRILGPGARQHGAAV